MRLPFVHTAIDALDTLLAITCPIRYTLSGSVISIRLVKLRLTGLVTFLADAPLHAFDAEVIKFVFHVIYLFFDFWLLERRERYAT